MLQSNTKFYLKGNISQALTVGGTFNISNDLELGLPVDTGGETVSIVFKNARQIERMTVTISQSVCTVVKRGIEQQGGNANAGLQKQWSEGVLGYITALDFDIVDKDGDSNTVSADMNFSGDSSFKKITFNSTTNAGLEVNSLTTSERTALSPVNGSVVYDETLGQLYMYIGGAWASIDTGTATPNMSETVNGTAEIATASERGSATSVGGTGARLVVSNDALKKTSSGASDENKIPVLNASGKVDAFVTPVSDASTTTKGIVELATDAEAITGTSTTLVPNLKQIGFNIVPGNATLAASTANVTFSNTTYEKKKEISVALAGIYRVDFNISNGNSGNGHEGFGRIYVNGVAVGTERSFGGTNSTSLFTENINVNSGDLIQLYMRIASNRGPSSNSLLGVYYATASKLPTGTVNL